MRVLPSLRPRQEQESQSEQPLLPFCGLPRWHLKGVVSLYKSCVNRVCVSSILGCAAETFRGTSLLWIMALQKMAWSGIPGIIPFAWGALVENRKTTN